MKLWRKENTAEVINTDFLFWSFYCIAGEKLMKQQLQTNNILKKLRAKEKEMDSTNKTQK